MRWLVAIGSMLVFSGYLTMIYSEDPFLLTILFVLDLILSILFCMPIVVMLWTKGVKQEDPFEW